ncbi:hypothetical protein [Phreatobacter stygius]|uniref:Uncharacterized protein n=1 Tax=Phreatobacter stygius TaxID=1940610 RepID=A0A4D7B6P3_9HYPH|nr:hypothetical protein [Phreatobacter stygius]QCI68651.1 hypothetical protein E8M01_33130 [Phreatobacter stygius]
MSDPIDDRVGRLEQAVRLLNEAIGRQQVILTGMNSGMNGALNASEKTLTNLVIGVVRAVAYALDELCTEKAADRDRLILALEQKLAETRPQMPRPAIDQALATIVAVLRGGCEQPLAQVEQAPAA